MCSAIRRAESPGLHGMSLSNRGAVAGHDVAAPTRPQHLVHVVFKGKIPRHRRYILAHDVGGVDAGERIADRHLRVALLRCRQQKPYNENPPKPAEPIALECYPNTGEDHDIGKELAGPRSNACSL